MIFRTTVPFVRVNDDLILSAGQRKVLTSHANTFVNRSFTDPQILGSTNDTGTRFRAGFLHYSFVYVVTETVSEYPYVYFTEKTWKAMATGVPFIMINAQNSLLKLQEFGFKTFNKWWDEGYDSKNTGADRIEAAVKILKDLSHLTLDELKLMRHEMDSVIKHNQQHLITFQELDLKNIANQI
jgi:hypothetical protein